MTADVSGRAPVCANCQHEDHSLTGYCGKRVPSQPGIVALCGCNTPTASAPPRTEAPETFEGMARALRDRVKLLDRIIGEHHSASVMREEHDICPVCTEYGGGGMFADTSGLLREAERQLASPSADTGGAAETADVEGWQRLYELQARELASLRARLAESERDRTLVAAMVREAWLQRPSDHQSWAPLEEEFDLLGIRAALTRKPTT